MPLTIRDGQIEAIARLFNSDLSFDAHDLGWQSATSVLTAGNVRPTEDEIGLLAQSLVDESVFADAATEREILGLIHGALGWLYLPRPMSEDFWLLRLRLGGAKYDSPATRHAWAHHRYRRIVDPDHWLEMASSTHGATLQESFKEALTRGLEHQRQVPSSSQDDPVDRVLALSALFVKSLRSTITDPEDGHPLEVKIDRDVESELLRDLTARPTLRTLIVGAAGHGKSMSLLALRDRLAADGKHPLILPASWLRPEPENLVIGRHELVFTAQKLRAEGSEVIVLLDSLDTLAYTESLSILARELLDNLADQGISVIATSRPGVFGAFGEVGWTVKDLGLLNDLELRESVMRLSAVYCPTASPFALVEKFMNTAVQRPDHRVRSPLLLRMAFQLASPRAPSGDVGEIEVHRQYWAERVLSDRRSPVPNADRRLDVSTPVMRLALAMMSIGAVEVSASEAVSVSARVRGLESSAVLSQHDIDDLVTRGILVRAGEQVSFAHQTFLEYAAGLAFVQRGGAAEIQRLVGIALDHPGSATTEALRFALLEAEDRHLDGAVSEAIVTLLHSPVPLLRAIAASVWAERPQVVDHPSELFREIDTDAQTALIDQLAFARPHRDALQLLIAAWTSNIRSVQVAVLRTLAARAPGTPVESATFVRTCHALQSDWELVGKEVVPYVLAIARAIAHEDQDSARALYLSYIRAPLPERSLLTILSDLVGQASLLDSSVFASDLLSALEQRRVRPARALAEASHHLLAMISRPEWFPPEMDQQLRRLLTEKVSLFDLATAVRLCRTISCSAHLSREDKDALNAVAQLSNQSAVREIVAVSILDEQGQAGDYLREIALNSLNRSLESRTSYIPGIGRAFLWLIRTPGPHMSVVLNYFRSQRIEIATGLGLHSLQVLAIACAAGVSGAAGALEQMVGKMTGPARDADERALVRTAGHFSYDSSIVRAALIVASLSKDLQAVAQLARTRRGGELLRDEALATAVLWAFAEDQNINLGEVVRRVPALAPRLDWAMGALSRVRKMTATYEQIRLLRMIAETSRSSSVLDATRDELDLILKRIGEPAALEGRDGGRVSPDHRSGQLAVRVWMSSVGSSTGTLPPAELATNRIIGGILAMPRVRPHHDDLFELAGNVTTRFAQNDLFEMVTGTMLGVIDALAARSSGYRWIQLVWPHLSPAAEVFIARSSPEQLLQFWNAITTRRLGVIQPVVAFFLDRKPGLAGELDDVGRFVNVREYIDTRNLPDKTSGLNETLLNPPEKVDIVTLRKTDVGIVTSVPVETMAVRSWLKRFPEFVEFVDEDGRWCYSATINTELGSRTVGLLQAKSQGQSSTVVAQEVLRRVFRPAVSVLLGIAGGIADGTELGDVVIAEQIIDYSPRAETVAGVEHRGASYQISSRWRGAVNHLLALNSPELELTSGPAGLRLGRTNFNLHFGPIGSGNAVVKMHDGETRDWLSKFNSKVLALETEGSGTATYFYEQAPKSGSEFLIVRGVSDRADHQKSDDWHLAASQNAVIVLQRLLDVVPMDHFKAE